MTGVLITNLFSLSPLSSLSCNEQWRGVNIKRNLNFTHHERYLLSAAGERLHRGPPLSSWNHFPRFFQDISSCYISPLLCHILQSYFTFCTFTQKYILPQCLNEPKISFQSGLYILLLEIWFISVLFISFYPHLLCFIYIVLLIFKINLVFLVLD